MLSKCWVLLGIMLLIGVIGSLYKVNISEGYNNFYHEQTELKDLSDKRYTLLGDWYPVNDPNPQFSNDNQEDQYKNLPILGANSLYSNNTKYWKQPSNGGCQPPGICQKFYKNKEITFDELPQMPPMTDEKNPRVNYFTSSPNRNPM